jgi:putative endonuclease
MKFNNLRSLWRVLTFGLSSYYFGVFAEYCVMIRYMMHMFVPIRHRWKCKGGEIDIIFVGRNSIIFCEVKARSSDFDDVFLTDAQKKRIIRSAEIFLMRNPKYRKHGVLFQLVICKYFTIKTYDII